MGFPYSKAELYARALSTYNQTIPKKKFGRNLPTYLHAYRLTRALDTANFADSINAARARGSIAHP